MTPSQLYYTVYFIFGISIICIVVVWNSELHKSMRFANILKLLTALTILFTSFAIILQLYVFHAQHIDTEIQLYDSMFKQLIDYTISYFERNPHMNYLYDQIFRPNFATNPTKRYYTEEQQIIRVILERLSEIIYYIDNDQSISEININAVKKKTDKFISELLRSSIFVETYKSMKNDILSSNLKKYIGKNFGI